MFVLKDTTIGIPETNSSADLVALIVITAILTPINYNIILAAFFPSTF
jgi:hypothetical protein